MVPPDQITLMDVSPNQLVSVAASLDPVPRARRREPRADGLEHAAAGGAAHSQRGADRRHRPRGEGRARLGRVRRREARRRRRVGRRDAHRRQGRRRGRRVPGHLPPAEVPAVEPEHLRTTRSPVVRAGDKVKVGDVIADGPSVRHGRARARPERGRRVHAVGWLQLRGLDPRSRSASRRTTSSRRCTSRSSSASRATRSSARKEITRDIPNVGEEALKDLDDSGIVRIGAEVKSGDILVGKITPKGETQLSPEEKLLRAIFGEKAGDVRDSSLRVPPGVARHRHQRARLLSQGHREGRARARRSRTQERAKLEKDMADEIKIIRESALRARQEAPLGSHRRGQARRRQGQGAAGEGREDRRTPMLEPIPRKYWGNIEIDKGKEKIDVDPRRSSTSRRRRSRRSSRRRSASSARATSCPRASSRW